MNIRDTEKQEARAKERRTQAQTRRGGGSKLERVVGSVKTTRKPHALDTTTNLVCCTLVLQVRLERSFKNESAPWCTGKTGRGKGATLS